MTRDEKALLVEIMTGRLSYASSLKPERAKAVSRLIRRKLVAPARSGYRWSHKRITRYALTDAGYRVAIQVHGRLRPLPVERLRKHERHPISQIWFEEDRYGQTTLAVNHL